MSIVFEGASTFSKMHRNYPEVVTEYADNGVEQTLQMNGSYFDTVSALGAQLFSYNNKGSMLSLPNQLERVAAIKIKEKINFIEMVRYGCNGADATEGAIRYARAFTKRQRVLSLGYHSCQSAFTNNIPPALGCIDGHVSQLKDYNDLIDTLKDLRDNWNDVAAVIMEPVMLDINVADKLKEIRLLTNELGIVLIFDEIITGCRVPKFCVSNWLNVQPDLILLGKAMGGGYPISIIAGCKDIMNVPVFHSYTFAGFPLALEQVVKTCSLTEFDLDKFYLEANYFMNSFNKLSDKIQLKGYGTRCIWVAEEAYKYLFWQQMYLKGILLGPAFFPRVLWTSSDYENLLLNAALSIKEIEEGVQLIGNLPEPIFKRS